MALFASAFVCAIVGAALGYAWPHLREHLRARRARQGLGPARIELDALLDDEVVTLCGVLRGVGSGPVATTTARYPGDPLATSSCADRLHVVVGNDPVELEGSVDVVVGAEEVPSRLSSELALTSHWATRRILRTGNRVVVKGCLRADHGDFSGYRMSNTKWTLLPAALCSHSVGASEAISMASVGVPRCYGARLPLVLAGALVGAILFPIGHGISNLLRLPAAQAGAANARAVDIEHGAFAEPPRHSRIEISPHGLGPLTTGTRSDIDALRSAWDGFHVGEIPWPARVNGSGYERYVVADGNGHRILMLEAALSTIQRAEIYAIAATDRGIGVGSQLAELFVTYPDATCRRDVWRSVAPGYGDGPRLDEAVVCWAASAARIEFAVAPGDAALGVDVGEVVPRERLSAQAKIIRMSYRFE